MPTTVTTQGITFTDNTTLTTANILPSQTGNNGRVLTTNGTTASWGDASISSGFTGTNQYLAGTGYQKIPGGLIIQWGISGSVGYDSNATVNFPIAFPNACLQAVACSVNSYPYDEDVFARVIYYTKSQISMRAEKAGGSANGTRYLNYIAIGY